jgi:amidase
MEEWSISELQGKMHSGELTSRQIVEMYLGRIEEIDKNGPALNSVIELNPDALAIADAMDQERRSGNVRGPMHGIPVLIKDNIDTHDRMMTTAGSLALSGSIPKQDAFLVQRLRTAGVVLLGKTNLSEWANFRSSRSSSGWSSRGGQTKNPHALDRSPCGSSSGSGAAVAANLCAVAIGTETNGSIICPSQANGIVGIKPTVGLVSRSGIIPISHSQDTAGPMARTVADAAALLGVMTGVDPQDAATLTSHTKALADYTTYLDPTGLQGARIGVARNGFGDNPRVTKIIEDSIAMMEKLGAEIIDPVNLENESKVGNAELQVLLYEFKADLNAYLASLGKHAPVHSLADVIAFNITHSDQVMPYFDQERMEQAEKKRDLNSKQYLNALARAQRLTRQEGIDAALQKHQLDAIVSLSGPLPWFIDLVNGDSYSPGAGGISMPAVAGYPCITVPAGSYFNLPVGISFFAGAWQEPVLIRMAYAFEQAAQARVTPRFLPTVQLQEHPA